MIYDYMYMYMYMFYSLFLFFQGKFVAAFAQSNEGDVSPNTKGARCIDTGKECDTISSTCDGKVSEGEYVYYFC